MIHLGDITKINGAEIEPVDVVTAGSPCQDLSVAGLRKGLQGERSGLFMEQIRVIKEMREHDKASGRTDEFVRPRYLIWENVTGAFSSGQPRGADFQCVLEEIAKIADEDALIPRLEGGRWTPSGCILADGWSIAWRVHNAEFWGTPQRRKRISLVADFGGRSAPEICFIRKGLSRDTEQSEAQRKEPAEAFRGCADKTSYTLKIRGGVETDSHGKKAGKGALVQVEKSATLGVSQDQTLIQVWSIDEKMGNTYIHEDLGNTLAQRDYKQPQAVFAINCRHCTEDEVAYALQSNSYKSLNGNGVCRVGSLVRRITPIEAERLMGFPDDWTNLGDWTDSKGKTHKYADSPRYKALGNSICLPYWFWLLRRVSAQYERPATLGSMFDGIGGFPLCWERCNGKGTARWASEIEEFPMAVTKKHFPEP